MRMIYNNPIERLTVTYPYVYWDDAFSAQQLDEIVKYCESVELDRAETMGGDTEKKRRSNVKFFPRDDNNAWIFDQLNNTIQIVNERWYEYDLNGYESFQFTTYTAEEAGHYDWHMDMSMGTNALGPETRKLSMTMLLSDDHEGGGFQICTGDQTETEVVNNKKGRMIFFPSFMSHRVMPVTKGVRKSLVIWILGPKFK